jgi:integrase/recombinase XerD
MTETDIKLFHEYLTVELGLAQNTRTAYIKDLELFRAEVDKDLRLAKRLDIVAYLQTLKNKRYAASTIARRLAALKSFYRFMAAEGYIELDPAQVIEAGNKGTRLPRVLTIGEVEKLLAAPELSNAEGFRTETMLERLYATGMRVSELISLKVTDINLNMKYVLPSARFQRKD